MGVFRLIRKNILALPLKTSRFLPPFFFFLIIIIKQVVVHENGMKLSLAYPRVLGASQQNMCPTSVKVIT